MSKAVANLTQSTETITFSAQDNGETISVNITEAARGPAGAAGAAGPNSVTSTTTSDGTANLSLSNVTTATAEVTGTLTADHIHGNLAGSVYAHVRAGEALAKGDPVYVSGSHGTGANMIAIVSLADAGDPLKMPAVGIMDADVAQNANGHMVITGTISDIDTSAFQVNDELYVNADPGPIDPRFTSTPPTALAQPVARVERANANNGAIIVKVNGLSASDATGNTLVRRTSAGGASFASLSSTGLSVASGTVTTSQPLSLTQTWNAAGVTFKGIDVNVTDTASASGSLLMDLRVGGISSFSVKKTGGIITSSLFNTANQSSIAGVVFGSNGNGPTIHNVNLQIGSSSAAMLAGVTSTGFYIGPLESPAYLRSDAANTLAQRNGANAQEFRLYGTTNAGVTEYERLKLKYNSTTLSYQIGTEKGGTTTSARPLEFQTDGTTRMTIQTAGTLLITGGIGTSNGSGGGRFGYYDGTNWSSYFVFTNANVIYSNSTATVGIGTVSPSSKLTIAGGDVEVTDSARGVILKSPNGTRYRITVANGGTLTVTAV